MATATRKTTELYLVGQPLNSFIGNLLPTENDVLKRISHLRDNSQENRKTVVEEVMQLWAKARIPTMETRSIIAKLIRILDNSNS